MIGRIIDAVTEHFGITEEQIEKVKTIIDMVEFKEVNGKRIAYITLGEGLEIKITQPEKRSSSQGPTSKTAGEELDRILGEMGFSSQG